MDKKVMKNLFKIIILSIAWILLISAGKSKPANGNDDKQTTATVEFVGLPVNTPDNIIEIKPEQAKTFSADKPSSPTKNSSIVSDDIGEPTALNIEGNIKAVTQRKTKEKEQADQKAVTNYILLLEEANAAQYGKNLLRVRKDGFGDFISIQAAIDSVENASADNSYAILVYPDTYDEKIILKDYVSLIGMDNKKCRVISMQKWNEVSVRSGAVVTLKKGQIRNLYIENLSKEYPGVALSMMEDESVAANCNFISHSQNAVMSFGGRIENCFIFSDVLSGEGSDALSISGSPIIRNTTIETPNISGAVWIGDKNSEPNFYNCIFRVKPSGAVLRLRDDKVDRIEPYIWNSEFFDWNYKPANMVMDEQYGKNTTIYSTGCIYLGKGEKDARYVEIKKGVDKFKELEVSGNTILKDTEFRLSGLNRACARFNATTGSFEFINPTGDNWDTNLYRGGVNELKTDDVFSANSLKIGNNAAIDNNGYISGDGANIKNLDGNNITTGTIEQERLPEPLNHAGNIAVRNKDSNFSATQSISASCWKDWAVCSLFPLGESSFGITGKRGWHIEDDKQTYLRCSSDDKSLLLPIPYFSGSRLNGIRIKFQGEGKGDGIKIRLLMRDELGKNGEWSVAGNEKSFTSSEINTAVYEFPDEELKQNFSYSVEIISIKDKKGVKVFSVGLRTSKRVY